MSGGVERSLRRGHRRSIPNLVWPPSPATVRGWPANACRMNSPDEKRVAISRTDPKNHTPAIWLVDLARNSWSRLNIDPVFHASAQWQPNGEHLLYRALHTGLIEFYRKSSSGSGAEETVYSTSEQAAVLGEPNNSIVPTHCSRDGRLLFHSSNPTTGWDIWVLDTTGDHKAFSAVQSRFNETHGVLSPNGRWLAYNSDESGRPEIYVSSFPDTTRSRRQVSTAGGAEPRWRSDGMELYYLARQSPDHGGAGEVGPDVRGRGFEGIICNAYFGAK